MVQIKFKAQGANSLIGGFDHGDIARVSDAVARHLVDEIGVADYVVAKPVAVDAEQTEQSASAETKKPRAKK